VLPLSLLYVIARYNMQAVKGVMSANTVLCVTLWSIAMVYVSSATAETNVTRK
jgi:hypothetical protein